MSPVVGAVVLAALCDGFMALSLDQVFFKLYVASQRKHLDTRLKSTMRFLSDWRPVCILSIAIDSVSPLLSWPYSEGQSSRGSSLNVPAAARAESFLPCCYPAVLVLQFGATIIWIESDPG